MTDGLGQETAVHGAYWAEMHGGYFSDPAVARPVVEAVRHVWTESRADVIADLGGGTGFLLSQIRLAGIGSDIQLVNLDCSAPQLAIAQTAGLTSIAGSVSTFRRTEVVSMGHRVLWLMRSVLHYAGEEGLSPLLRHLREQMEPGEIWIHQTACFKREEDADCLNALYRHMHTVKWYPTISDLQSRLETAGWRVEAVTPTPTLRLKSDDLGRRYGLDQSQIQRIGGTLAKDFGARNKVFQLHSDGFWADLRYRLFVCRAAS
jgi:hypothetical protein